MRRALPMLLLLVVAAAVPATVRGATETAPAPAGVAPAAWQRALGEGTVDVLVELRQQAETGGIGLVARDKTSKGREVFSRLRASAEGQRGLRQRLGRRGIAYRSFWIVSALQLEADRDILAWLARQPEVAAVHWNAVGRFDGAVEIGGLTPRGVDEIEPNITHVGADDFWAAGFTGQGVVIGGADTGHDWDHPALKAAYRGWNGVSASHDYNWLDAVHTSLGLCGADSQEPCDDLNHGTHTIGIAVGDGGSGRRIGMAPGARWIGCRNMNAGVGTVARYLECLQFFLAPTDRQGQNPMPELAPDVTLHAWLCSPEEGCTEPGGMLELAMQNLRNAGIFLAVSAGNTGGSCSTVEWPTATYAASFTVGAIANSADEIASFSSRGPVTFDASGRLKPDVTAPGSGISSSIRNGAYANMSGTSMASPHVAGLAALLISARGCLRGDVDTLEQYIIDTAVPRTTNETCGGTQGVVPNNTYGWGSVRAVPPPIDICPGTVFADDFEQGATGLWSVKVP